MIIPNPKKAATVIVSRIGSSQTHEEKPEASSQPDISALHAIASDMLQAIKDGSPSDLASALKAFLAEHEVTEE